MFGSCQSREAILLADVLKTIDDKAPISYGLQTPSGISLSWVSKRRSAKMQVDYLEHELSGYNGSRRNPTAFVAEWERKAVHRISGEYDALAGVSQEVGWQR